MQTRITKIVVESEGKITPELLSRVFMETIAGPPDSSKGGQKRNKLVQEDQLASNIDSRKKKDSSRPRTKLTVSSESYRRKQEKHYN